MVTALAARSTKTRATDVIGNLALNILPNYINIVADPDNEFPFVAPYIKTAGTLCYTDDGARRPARSARWRST